eukprot:gnl/Chilomastix_caulleri/3323.p1 GENE.gnl/Chilomastix_caulleri/3323~~gnl/Chilomastix_caulleri/3323.p1  ORF type:complete len:102 (+),score=11.12 gnl/Chilomastix_caulleri/3323:199-504(+)
MKMWMNIGLNHQLLTMDLSIPSETCSLGTTISNETTALKVLGLLSDPTGVSETISKSEMVNELDAQDVYTLLNASSGSIWTKHDQRDNDIRELAEVISAKK